MNKLGWVMVKVQCYSCHKKERIKATSFKVGVIAFREKGWRYDKIRGWKCLDCMNKAHP